MKTACSLDDRLAWWSGVLQLNEFEVVHQVEDVAEKTLRFTVIPKVGAAVCPHCGGLCGETHQTRDRDGIHDLPIGERAVVLRVRVREFRCDACERCFTPPWQSIAEGTHATERFLERAAAIIRHSDISNAARLCGVVKNLQERLLAARRELQRELPKDEARKLKGSRWLWAKNLENLTVEERQ